MVLKVTGTGSNKMFHKGTLIVVLGTIDCKASSFVMWLFDVVQFGFMMDYLFQSFDIRRRSKISLHEDVRKKFLFGLANITT
ncbi:hypothetical protein M0802_009437 [Mischocyttarus mexicanus]|nr:hypothetical protein M0802_009437 [Mischocyttarus mexicanus]